MSKTAKTKAKATESKEETNGSSWYDIATEVKEFHKMKEGLNYFLLLDNGALETVMFEGEESKRIKFEASLLSVREVTGKHTRDSPKEPIEGILSVPLSVGRKIRQAMITEKIELGNLPEKVLIVQKTGKGKHTRYPLVNIIEFKDYE